jgi:hypothetical protein
MYCDAGVGLTPEGTTARKLNRLGTVFTVLASRWVETAGEKKKKERKQIITR